MPNNPKQQANGSQRKRVNLLSLFLSRVLVKGVVEVDEKRWSRVRTYQTDHKSMWQRFWVLIKQHSDTDRKGNQSGKRWGGVSSHKCTSQVIRKQMVNTTHNRLRLGFYTSLLAYHADRISNMGHIIYILILWLVQTHKAEFFIFWQYSSF
jgi:hypothetical protein